jgi:hypothetical protein
MENTLYPPMTIQLDVYYWEDEQSGTREFDEEEMRRDFENRLEELKNKFGRLEK